MAMTAVAAAPVAAATPAASAATTSNAGTVAKLTVNFVLDGDTLDQKVVSIVQDEIGGFSIDAVKSSA